MTLKALLDAQPYSQVTCNSAAAGASGYGSTSTRARKFTNSTVVGSGITYVQSATLGSTFTIAEAGVYSITYIDGSSAAAVPFGITKNADGGNNLTGETTTTMATVINQAAGEYVAVCATARLAVGDVILAHTNASANFTGALVKFTITQVARY